jgi:NAD(P)-dependent dehydrogenase (short-subunit alcohol dehydrogenase family)
MEIKNNVFIITGGASGLGAATARMIVENGGKVVLADVQVEAGEKLAAELKGQFLKCDVTSEADGMAVVAAAEAMGQLVGLINCAGVAPAVKTVGKDGAHPLEVFQRVVNINLVGTFNMSRLAAMAMSNHEPNAAGERGVIINTASVAAYDGQIGQAAYGSSKAGCRWTDFADGARFVAQWSARDDDCSRYFRDAHAARYAPGSSGCAGSHGAFPPASGQTGGVRASGENHH